MVTTLSDQPGNANGLLSALEIREFQLERGDFCFAAGDFFLQLFTALLHFANQNGIQLFCRWLRLFLFRERRGSLPWVKFAGRRVSRFAALFLPEKVFVIAGVSVEPATFDLENASCEFVDEIAVVGNE